jgi:hypothetical protein
VDSYKNGVSAEVREDMDLKSSERIHILLAGGMEERERDPRLQYFFC